MLRARAWKDRSNPFVCTLCRQKLAVNAGSQHARLLSTSSTSSRPLSALRELATDRSAVFSCQARSLSRTACLNNSANNEGPPKTGGFPGAFSNTRAGGWGTFAKADTASGATTAADGLLPHERLARRQSAATESVQTDKKNEPKSNEPKKSTGNQRRNTPQATKSRSVLADVFKTNREPRAPPTPESWSSPHNRKADVPPHTHGVDPRGNQSGVWNEITKSRKLKTKPSAAQEPVTQDFWGELETRATGFREKVKSKNENQPVDRKKKTQDTQDKRDSLGETFTSTPKTEDDTQLQKQRRKSRFEVEEQQEPEKPRSKKGKKSQRVSQAYEDEDWDDEAVHRWEQKQRRKAEKEAKKQKVVEEEPQAVPIFLPEYISASNLSRALKQNVTPFLQDMEEMGFENITSDTIFTGETAALIAMEYGFEPTVDTGSLRDLRTRPPPTDVSVLPSRPPVVTIMGHVDHGKTTLLDWLRKSSVAAQEHGGITQHIGAFVVKMSSGKSITFLDTPGHAAFLSMRQRGANVTDIVVLVVAADDSVMPQTLEALKHATSAKVPIIVAITKVDKEDARIDQVKADLSRHGVEIEDYGGDVQVVCVSGKTGLGMEDLEENIVTLSEILDVRAEDDGMAEGWVLESSIKPQGKAATILVKRGTLRPGDLIVAGKTWAKIRVLRNEAGLELDSAPPGTPVEVLGWRELPTAGEQIIQSPDEGKAKTAVEYRLEMAEREQSSIQLAEQEQRQREKAAADAAAADADGASNIATESAETGILTQNFTVKADVVGSVEAVCGTILELGSHEVQPKILRSSAGQITEYDIDHAATSNSIIVNFNINIPPHIKQRAEEAKVKILDHKVIYHVVDDVKAALSDILPMNISFRVNGEADVLQVFPINVKKRVFRNIAGCRVRNGSIKKSSRVKVLRRGEVVYDGKIDTLKHVKKDVQEMGKGTECGIGLEDFEDFQPDDQIQTYEEIKERRSL
ncbi:elongation factor tu GTP binding domain-containing protein [Trichoderma breve]|uniref:Translation initiation factor IF-2, mitochondrial n=1 Tax=Trichoderma breve TaxID=2034170 RepID=A0A9W9E8Z3_9HYPO|nr:elongation factor tu GTP binding domain-containing protein [Trichoderma breve]KAJ4862175.1 elongation factor tu GTP binding domain-containing protein [Trichoderma breve]